MEKQIKIFGLLDLFLPAINATVFSMNSTCKSFQMLLQVVDFVEKIHDYHNNSQKYS